ncbi:MAG: UDP-glucose/GDP-mannose dehydrogenase family protein [Vulcanimicrobiaceae bacterium]
MQVDNVQTLGPAGMRRFCIVGTGYVGMASAIGFAEFGHEVVGYDIIRERIRGLQNGVTPYREEGLAAALQGHLATGRLRFAESLSEAAQDAEFVVIAVGTPSRPDGSADLSYLYSAIDALLELDLAGKTLVIRSTVPAGTTDFIAARLRGVARVIHAPEFLREGSALKDFLDPDRVVVGADPVEAAGPFLSLFGHTGKPLIATSPCEAELIKGFSNAYLALKISFANEVANLCDVFKADALSVLFGIGNDTRIGKLFLQPGIGYGGPCFDKDVRSMHHIAREHESSRELLSATLRVNEAQPRRVVDLLEKELGCLDGKSIGVWGLTFKAGTDDVRDSLAIRIIDDLVERGARVRAYDPAVTGPHTLIHCELVPSPLDALDADALLVLTDWPLFREIPARAIADRLRHRVVVDGRNALDREALAAAGIRYRGVGRRATPAVEQLVFADDRAEVVAS